MSIYVVMIHMISPLTGSMVKPESPPEMPEMGSWRDLKGQSRSTAAFHHTYDVPCWASSVHLTILMIFTFHNIYKLSSISISLM